MNGEQALTSLGYSWRMVSGSFAGAIPPLCTVPEGPFLMGSDPRRDPQARADEQPQHTGTLSTYQIACYPVTVAEYALALAAGAAEVKAPVNWEHQRASPMCPVSALTWYDAWAYARWLSQVTGRRWRLPTEVEWEKAARGTDGRIYPWGDNWETGRANGTWSGAAGAEGTTTTAVNAYPQGASPYGLLDLVGNVAEWTSTRYDGTPKHVAYPIPPARTTDVQEGATADTWAAMTRGGCWMFPPEHLRAAQRDTFSTTDRFDWLIGVRLVCDAQER